MPITLASRHKVVMVMPAAFLISALIQFVLGLVLAWLMGPAEFGRYALALAGAAIMQVLVFDWLRLSATRYHREGAGIARRLTRIHVALGGLALAAALILAVVAPGMRLLVAMLPVVAFCTGYVEFRAALRRAEFDQRRYLGLILFRNITAFLVMPAIAYAGFGAEGVMAAYLLTLVVTAVADSFAGPIAHAQGDADSESLVRLFRYAMPIVITNLLYLLLFFGLRVGVAELWGVAEAGRFSLALEFVLKLFATIGTAMDLLLFQLAVRTDREEGSAAADRRLVGNLRLIIAMLAPMALGLALVLPGVEAIVASPDYRGAFLAYAGAVIPGIALYALIQYGLHPFEQLRQRTVGLILAAGAACAAAIAVLVLSKHLPLPAPLLVGLVLAGAMGAGIATLGTRIGRSIVPGSGFLFRLCAALAVLAAIVLLLKQSGSSTGATAAAIAGGAVAYLIAAIALDLAGMRAMIIARFRR